MIELDIIKLNKKGICVNIKSMTLDEWKSFKRTYDYDYRAFQKGVHQFTKGK